MVEALHIQVKGIVQGVGFRPFVYRLAKRYLINGWVLNATDGVSIHAEGDGPLLDEFVLELAENPPAASQVTEIELKEVPLEGFDHFEIRFSDDGAVEKTTLISPDMATCDDCVRELFDPADRRYRYPFINCTNCGPRFTIIDKLPYDRKNTSMAAFPMCSQCAAEYGNPLNRRFHAQPDACFECGPVVFLAMRGEETESPQPDPFEESEAPGTTNVSRGSDKPPLVEAHSGVWSVRWGTTQEESDDIFNEAVKLLTEGKILAVKGLGGYHLACDANNVDAVATLRARKHRDSKAFAVMMPDVRAVEAQCLVNETEKAVLTSVQRPIVLLRKRPGTTLVHGLADRLSELGVMLPYTPVQHLLLHDFAEQACDNVVPMLVMTSGNVHDEPIVISDEEALEKLSGIADAFLGNNRPILTRFDDSVVRVISAGSAGHAIQFIRRARGYAPQPLRLSFMKEKASIKEGASRSKAASSDEPRENPGLESTDSPTPMGAIFATGPEQKNTFTILRDDEAFVSQHIGDMENADTYDAWLGAKDRFLRLFEAQPRVIACDLHPEYLTSKWAHEQEIPVIEVQHHHAHIVSAMAEHGLTDAVCGFSFDGTGYGTDGQIWGGEVLLSNLITFERFANFAYVPMPGGQAAIKHPLRMAYGVLWGFGLLDHPGARRLLNELGSQADLCERMIEQGVNTPMTSSVGRLFDAASALLGVCVEPTYEGEGAVLLEAAIANSSEDVLPDAASRYAFTLVKNAATDTSTARDTSVVLLDGETTFRALLDDLVAGVPVPAISLRFHHAFVQLIVDVAELVRGFYEIDTMVLSGGVFMNRYVIEHVLPALEERGFTAVINRDVPPNDGCMSLGQTVVAWANLMQTQEK